MLHGAAGVVGPADLLNSLVSILVILCKRSRMTNVESGRGCLACMGRV